MTVIRLVVGYTHAWPNDGGFYLARQRGLYEAAGLDVRISAPDAGRGDGLAHLAREEFDLGVVPLNRLLAARSRGERVAMVAAINQTGLETILALGSRGIERPRDLVGKRVALHPTPRGVAFVRHLVAVDGGDPEAVELVDPGPGLLGTRHLRAGAADAFFGNYWVWDELLDPDDSPDRLVWPVKDIGAPDYHSYVLVAREDFLAAHPEEAAAFLRASAAGFGLAAQDPEASASAFKKVTGFLDVEVLRRSFDLVRTTWFHDGRWGVVRDEAVTPYAHWLHERGALPDVEGLAGAVDARFLDAVPAAG